MAKISEVAGWVGAEAPARNGEVSGASSIEAARADRVVFAVDAEALAAALKSGAGAILANESLREEGGGDPRVLWVKDSRYAFAISAKQMDRNKLKGCIHSSVLLGEEVVIGEETSIGPGV